MPSERPTTPADMADAIASLVEHGVDVRVNIRGSEGDAGIDPDEGADNAFFNPMTGPGDLIAGTAGGAPVRVAAGTVGQAPIVQTDGTVAFASVASAAGQYRQYVWEIDGSGGWELVSEDDGTGQLVPVFESQSLE